ncbi:MAG TPA: dihydrofolate reductase family protein [Conexibacter sp.]|jgi:5-amino-6-(5-phosphoribosylamino)uracil reductase
MEFNRLLPTPATVDSLELLGDLRLAELAPAERPYVIANFAATVDGRIAIDGKSGSIGDDGDREVFRRLRTQPEALLVGTGTIAAEGYSRPIRRADLRAAREAIGLSPTLPIVTVTRSGRLPLEVPLFADPEAHVIVYTTVDAASPQVAARVDVVRIEEHEQPLAHAALHDLRVNRGIRSVLCEGGPMLFGSLLAERLVDELFLTMAPLLTSGGELPMTAGDSLPEPTRMALRWLLERNGSLYLRYKLT